MFCTRTYRLLTVNSLAALITKNNCQHYNQSYFIRLLHKQTKNGISDFESFKRFFFYNNFCLKTHSRHSFYNEHLHYGRHAKLITLSGLLSFLHGKEEDKESELIMTIKRGILSIQREEYKVAEQILHVALRLAQEQQNEDGVTYVYDLLANVAFQVGEWEKAEKLFVNVMQRELGAGLAKDDMKIIHMSLKLAKIYESLKQDEKAENGFQFCMENLQRRIDKSTEDEDVLTLWAMTLDWYARFLQQKSRFNEALVFYKKAYDMCVKLNGEIHEQNVILLNDIGTITFLKGDKDDALDYMIKAIEIGKHLPNMEDFSSVYVNLGNIYLQKGMFEEAKKSCTEGFQNATRHKNEEGIKEANICLEEIKKLYKK
ncbi:tetratricopeptide repeat domain 19 [Lycorma delicatula]|uniref:tetratricopeptide repeat domain 19 n=1 Tax=Lycorma delicatula TaxID=130591 RepID=UPI003F50FCC4